MTPEQVTALVKDIDPGAKLEGDEQVLRNPQRNDKSRGSFKINLDTRLWSDFAINKGGPDAVSFWAYCNGIPYDQAAEDLD